MPETWSFHSAGQIIFGRNSVGQLGDVADLLEAKRILIVTDRILEKAGLVERVRAPLTNSGAELETFEGGEPEPSLEEQIERVSPCDLLLVEGHKRHPLPKLEVWRRENGKPLLYPEDEHIVAIASDTMLETKLPRFDLNDHEGIGNFILSYNGF